MLLYLPLSSHSPSAHPAIAFFFWFCHICLFPLPSLSSHSLSCSVWPSFGQPFLHTHTYTHTKPLFPQVLKILENCLNFCVVFFKVRRCLEFWFSRGLKWLELIKVMKQHFQTILLMAGSVLFPSCTLVNSLLFSSLHLRLLFVLVVVWCRAVLACCPRPDQNTHTHTHCYTPSKTKTHTHTHTHRACSVSSNITSDTFGLLVVFPRHGYEHAAFLCVGGLFKKKKRRGRWCHKGTTVTATAHAEWEVSTIWSIIIHSEA